MNDTIKRWIIADDGEKHTVVDRNVAELTIADDGYKHRDLYVYRITVGGRCMGYGGGIHSFDDRKDADKYAELAQIADRLHEQGRESPEWLVLAMRDITGPVDVIGGR